MNFLDDIIVLPTPIYGCNHFLNNNNKYFLWGFKKNILIYILYWTNLKSILFFLITHQNLQ